MNCKRDAMHEVDDTPPGNVPAPTVALLLKGNPNLACQTRFLQSMLCQLGLVNAQKIISPILAFMTSWYFIDGVLMSTYKDKSYTLELLLFQIWEMHCM